MGGWIAVFLWGHNRMTDLVGAPLFALKLPKILFEEEK